MQNMPAEELMEREAGLAAEVERLLPDFVNSCRDKAYGGVIHQDAFAADYQDDEYALLGKAISSRGSTERKSASSGKTGKRSREQVNPNCCNERMRSLPLAATLGGSSLNVA